MVVEGGTTIEVFLMLFEHGLCLALRPGRVVLLDNLRVHKNRAVTERIEATGARVLFLPRHRPDFQPIKEPSPSSRRSCAARRHAPKPLSVKRVRARILLAVDEAQPGGGQKDADAARTAGSCVVTVTRRICARCRSNAECLFERAAFSKSERPSRRGSQDASWLA